MENLKKILVVAILFCLGLVSVQTKAQTVGTYFSSGGLYYQITSNVYPNFEVKMTSITGNSTNIVIPSKVTYNGDEYTVTSIGYQNGYYGSSYIESVTGRANITIPNTVKYIECGAFHGAFEITLEEGNTNYVMENRCLYNKAKDTLIVHARGMATQDYTLTLPSTVKYISQWAFFRSDNLTSLSLPSSLKYIGDYALYLSSSLETCTVQEGLDSIGDNAFNSCTKLKEITIPKTVTYLGPNIFIYCDSLKTMYYNAISVGDKSKSNDLKAKFVASNLDKVIIGNEVQKLPYGLFAGCSKITEVNFPASLRSIGGAAFNGCNRITSITFPDSLQTIDNGAFEGVVSVSEITIPAGLTYMGNNAFANTTSLKTVHWNAKHCNSLGDIYNHSVNWTNVETATIGNDVEVIPWYLFADCKNLKTITIPASIDSIGIAPLYGCDSLEYVYYNAKNAVYTGNYQNGIAQNGKIQNFVIGNNVETIPAYLLSNEKGITSLTFPNSLKKIGDYAFNNCGNLQSAPLPNNIESIGGCSFQSTAISTLTIPKGVTYIGEVAFADCSNLKEVIYNSVRASYYAIISRSMFDNDTALTNVTISNDVEYIPNYFLMNNKKAEITLPTNIKRIGIYAFAGTNIKELTVTSKMDTIGQNAFENCDSLTIIDYNAPSLVNEMIPYQADYIFKNCKNIQKMTISENVSSLPNYWFKNCNIDTILAYPLTAAYFAFVSGSVNYIGVPCGSYDSYYNTWNPFSETLHRLGDAEYTTVEQTICQGEEFEFNSQKLTQSGEYVANLLNKYECDSIVTLNLTVNPAYDTLIESIIQSGDTYTLNGFTQQSEGNYIQNLQTVNGCDSIIRLSLTTLRVDTVTLVDTLTIHDTVTNTIHDTTIVTEFDTITITEIVHDTVTTIDTLTITLYDTVNTTDTIYIYDSITPCAKIYTYIYATINNGETYTNFGFIETEAGEYTQTLQTEDGCDSIITLILQVTSGMNSVSAEKIISIHPNPAKEEVTLDLGHLTLDGNEKITILNSTGQIVYKANIKSQKSNIDVSGFESGVYYIKVGNIVKKLIVK